MHYDVEYISPSGFPGKHIAVIAKNAVEAGQKSMADLSFGSPWKPEDFTIVSVVPSPKENLPMTPEEIEQFNIKQNSILNRLKRIFK